jgi:RecA/RadA recombinase
LATVRHAEKAVLLARDSAATPTHDPIDAPRPIVLRVATVRRVRANVRRAFRVTTMHAAHGAHRATTMTAAAPRARHTALKARRRVNVRNDVIATTRARAARHAHRVASDHRKHAASVRMHVPPERPTKIAAPHRNVARAAKVRRAAAAATTPKLAANALMPSP